MAQFLTAHSSGGRGKYDTPELLSFVTGLMAREGSALAKIRENTVKDGLPPISIGPDEGKILDALARLSSARKAVEVGTLAGYSGVWIARALAEGGKLHTIEFDPKHAKVARRNFAAAGVAEKVVVHEGAGVDVLPALEKDGPFDLCFIDADKNNYENYGRWAAKNVRSGGLVIGDNAYLFGKLHLSAEKAGKDASGVAGMQGFLKLLADPKLFSSCAMIPTGEGLAVGVRR
jgi:caffeoyl-CoA O-methyltransferase